MIRGETLLNAQPGGGQAPLHSPGRALAFIASSILLISTVPISALPAGSVRWEVQGEMAEACTCQVPCTCNFGQGPSPHHFCWSLASFHFEKGHFGKVNLDNLHLVRAHGNVTTVWYIDSKATSEQAEALQALIEEVRSARNLHFEKARIEQTAGGAGFAIQIGDQGGFRADKIIGMDGKTPIIVENMTAWNVKHDIKGKTTEFEYKDGFGNRLSFNGTNANLGKFDWTNETPNPF
ncbi:MAG: DUF1326 domain-containing protein [Acidobacteriota bacterium]|nr:DUF1326 domain-containing protein [Acidobacteriota bacterium]